MREASLKKESIQKSIKISFVIYIVFKGEIAVFLKGEQKENLFLNNYFIT